MVHKFVGMLYNNVHKRLSNKELYYWGEAFTADQPQSFTCPYCGKMGFTESALNNNNNNNNNLILILRAFYEMIKRALHDFYL